MLEPSENCPIFPCVKLLSGAWALEVLFYLQSESLHFGELRRKIGTVSAKVLTTRLRELEGKQVVRRKKIEGNPPMMEYSLTEIGRELLPVLEVLSQVSQRLQHEHGIFD